MMDLGAYTKSAQCSVLIKETADVTVTIDANDVVWGACSLGDAKVRPIQVWSGADPPNQPFSVVPLVFGQSAMRVQGFAVPERGFGHAGPSYSGLLQIDLYLWATAGTHEVSLSISDSVDVQFRFGEQDWAPVIWAPPVRWQPHGTIFPWPSAV